MTPRRIAGLVLVILGIVALAWGGVFWKERDTIVDAGPVQITRDEQKGFPVPPLVGGALLVAGVILLVLPQRSRP